MGASCSLPDGSELKGPDERVSQEVLVRANVALVFVKPQAATEAGVKFVRERLEAVDGLCILGDCGMEGDGIKAGNFVDQHYAEIAERALRTDPSDLVLGDAEKKTFAETYGVEYEVACEEHCVLNAQEYAVKFGSEEFPLAAKDLSQLWDSVPEKVKVASGAYVCRVRGGGSDDLDDDMEDVPPVFVVNGFYPLLKAKFEAKDAKIRLFVVAFDPKILTWADFRRNVIGATNPDKAAPGSLRADILENFEALGIREPPNTTDNGVHGSAGPLEALKERILWLNFDKCADPTGSKLSELALWDPSTKSLLDDLLQNPIVDSNLLGGGSEWALASSKKAFDLTEDKDTPDLYALANNLAFAKHLQAIATPPTVVPPPAAATTA